jgi:hypothetical protein
MTSAGGSGLLTSVVGPAYVSVDWLTGQVGSMGQWVPLVSHTMSLAAGTHVSGW